MSLLTGCVARNEESMLLQTPQHTFNAYAIYVVFILLITNILKLFPRYLLGVLTTPMSQELEYGEQRCMSANETSSTAYIYLECTTKTRNQCEIADNHTTDVLCKWDYDGNGVQFEMLVGPVFIIAYCVASLLQGFLVTDFKRQTLLAATVTLLSLTTLLNGFLNRYWQLVLTTIGSAIGQAGAAPFAVTLIYDHFDGKYRALAMGVFTSGCYLGIGMAFVVGNSVTDSLGWRWAWIIGGVFGLIIAVIVLTTIREPQRITPPPGMELSPLELSALEHPKQEREHQQCCVETSAALRSIFLQPALPILFFATFVRLVAGYVWANNSQLFYQDYGLARETIGTLMLLILSIGGSVSVVLGGFIVDRFRTDESGLSVLITCQAIAAFFSFGTILCPPPYSFVNLVISYVVGELYVSITYVVVIDLVSAEYKVAAVGVFMSISHLGGLMSSVVPPLRHLFSTAGYAQVSTLKAALLLLYSSMYAISAILYFLTLVALRCHRRHLPNGYERHHDHE